MIGLAGRMLAGDARAKEAEAEKKKKQAEKLRESQEGERNGSTIFEGSHKKSAPLDAVKTANKRKIGDVEHEHNDGDEAHTQDKRRRISDINGRVKSERFDPIKEKYAYAQRVQQREARATKIEYTRSIDRSERRNNTNVVNKQGEGFERGSEKKIHQSDKLVEGAIDSLNKAVESSDKAAVKPAEKPADHTEKAEQTNEQGDKKGAGEKKISEKTDKSEATKDDKEAPKSLAEKAMNALYRYAKNNLEPKQFFKHMVDNTVQWAKQMTDRLSQITGGSGSSLPGNNQSLWGNQTEGGRELEEDMRKFFREGEKSLEKSFQDKKVPTLPDEANTKAAPHADAHNSGVGHEHTNAMHEHEAHQEHHEHHKGTAKKDHDEHEKHKDSSHSGDNDKHEKHKDSSHSGDNTVTQSEIAKEDGVAPDLNTADKDMIRIENSDVPDAIG